ncbi:MAG TPA: DUF3037 domain-containing protein [Gaiellaceae bacterium]|nr:DUF3037 domain-containing protein [Gaiellaceae bacterium]
MPGRNQFSYALYRLVPDLERGERLNVGVIVFSRPLDFLGARTHLDEERVAAVAPEFDPKPVRPQLLAIERIASGSPDGGPIAGLDSTARFHWLTAPSSTVVRSSAVHTGLCEDPERVLDELFRTLVLTQRG